ncbi:MAG: deoxyribodipyrimidine photo-lyase, partial [Flammeovirgaceae bacterium]
MYDSINIVWFKRDLRLNDHQPLMCAVADNTPALLVYFFEPTSMAGADSDVRHWRFVQESIHDLNQTLQPKHQIYAIHQEVVTSLEQVQKHFKIK